MERALIIGCGYTGAALARQLTRRGIPVAGTSAAGRPVEGVTIRTVDLLHDPADPPLELPEAADAVVFYMVATLTRSYEGRAHLPPFRRCLAALAQQPVRGLIYLSSTSVYGDRGDRWVDEETQVRPQSPWGRMRVELEREAWAFGSTQGIPACVVRLPEIYGPGRGPVERLRRGYVLRKPDRFSNRIYIDDLAEILALLGERMDIELLLAADGQPDTRRTVYGYAALQMGLPDEALVEERGAAALEAAGDENRRALIAESKRCCNDRLLRWLGRPLRYPSYREGIKAILQAEGSPPG
jgi:nucleoside-diphosphate-sugar epimerase